ncbi:MAG: radical SAM protein [Dehalococcoidales bacterium]|nr:radical SAM protein [Dehalococcoidales bacterium]
MELVKAIETGEVLELIKGIVYQDRDEVVAHPPREPEKNLDSIPHPARWLLDMGRYSTHHFQTFGIKVPKMKSTTLISSRGCVYKCSFCDRQACGTRWYARSPEDIIGEMVDLRAYYGIRGFVFNDDTFVVNRKRVLDFCTRLENVLPDIVWYCNGRVNLMDEEMIQAMARSGCVGIAYGIESGNQAILDSVHKQITLEQVERIVALTKKYGIHVTGYFMLGILGDTKQTIQETLDFAEKLDLDFYGFGITSPIPGTEMYAEAVKRGLVDKDKRLEDWSFHAQMNLTTDCSYGELEALNEYAFRHFTIEKRWGKHYLLNPRLWFEGLRTLVFLARKRNVSELLRKVVVLLKH